MRLLTFSFLRNCKFKQFYYFPKRLRSDSVQQPSSEPAPDIIQDAGDPSLIEVSPTWPIEEQPSLRAAALRDMRVWPEFVSGREEAALLAELEPALRRMRYEYDHWDNAIHGYRETERSTWLPENEAVLQRVRALAFQGGERPLPAVHVLDLAAAGHIKPHVDAVRFCGAVIAGLCLSSSAVMRLVHEEHRHLQFDALLPRRCLYIMRGVARYSFSHAVLGGADSSWRGQRLARGRRVALICRSEPPPAAPGGEPPPAASAS